MEDVGEVGVQLDGTPAGMDYCGMDDVVAGTTGPSEPFDFEECAAALKAVSGPFVTKIGMRRGEFELLEARGSGLPLPPSLLEGVPVFVRDFMPEGALYEVHYSNGDVEWIHIDGKIVSFRPQPLKFSIFGRPSMFDITAP